MDATIYTKENCIFCSRAKVVLEPYSPKILKLDEDFNREQFFELFPTAKTFPQIIINGEKIGGFTELEQWMAFNKPDENFLVSLPKYQEVLDFWFKESSSKDHWAKNDEYDQKIRDRFLVDVEKAIKNEYDDWQDEAKSSLALIILLDQLSRNLFRSDPRSYSQDTKARLLVTEGVDRQYLDELETSEKFFYLLPLIHSEDLQDHIYLHQLGEVFLKDNPNYEHIKKSWNDHTVVIKKFGRYPHRNEILNRKSTSEEIEFLKGPNSAW